MLPSHRRSVSEPMSELEPKLSIDQHDHDYEWHIEANVSTNPKDWPERKKWIHVLLIAALTMAIPLGSTIHAPGLPQIAKSFEIPPTTASFTVQIYVLGFSIAPFVFLPLSKIYGRLYIYYAANLLLLIGHLGCAIAPNFAWLLAFRVLAGCGGACAITQGSGTIADIIEKERRGRAVALIAFGTVWAPTLGPVIGGWVVERWGWRKCFWVLTFVTTINTLMTLICMDETSTTHYTRIYHFLSEEEKTLSLLPSTTEDNHIKSTLSTTSKTAIVIKAILSPFQLLVHPVFITTALLSATFYTIQIYLYTDIPATYSTIYFFSPSETGLVFLGIGIGMTLGLLAFGLFSDRIMTTLAGAGKRQARHRLPLMCVYAMLVAVGLVVFAVSARQGVFWLVPVIGNAITGAGLYSFSVGAATYLIDLCPARAADSATLLAVVRFPIGAFMSAAGLRLVPLLGRAPVEILLAVLAIQAVPVTFWMYRHGGGISLLYRSQ